MEERERLHALSEAASSIEELISAKSSALAAGDGDEHSTEAAGDGTSQQRREERPEQSGRHIGRES